MGSLNLPAERISQISFESAAELLDGAVEEVSLGLITVAVVVEDGRHKVVVVNHADSEGCAVVSV